MAKRIFVAFDGRMMSLRRAMSTWAGWKHLLVILPVLAILRLRRVVRGERAKQQQVSENNCPVVVKTEDGIPVRCMYYMTDGKTCPRHGDVSALREQPSGISTI